MLPEGPSGHGAAPEPPEARPVTAAVASGAVGRLLQKHQHGEPEASSELVALVEAEIQRRAPAQHRERAGASADEQLANLLSTILSECALAPDDRGPFFAVYAKAVRRVLCEAVSRPGSNLSAVDDGLGVTAAPEMLAAIDRVLAALERVNTRLVTAFDCLYFARLTEEETAAALSTDVASVRREWIRARAWVLKELTAGVGTGAQHDVTLTNAVWVDAVLRNAVILPPDERDAFLEQCHAAAPGLRQDVEDLLHLSEADVAGPEPDDVPPAMVWAALSGSRTPPPLDTTSASPAVSADPPALPRPKIDLQLELDRPYAPAQTVAPDPPRPIITTDDGVRLGAWRVISRISSRGGAALEEVARDGRSERAAGWLMPVACGPSAAALFFSERCRHLSALRHPGLARILDWGESSDGRLFVVREYATGQSIDRHCDEQQLDTVARVRLLVRLCGAVQHAHRLLIAHGSIHASNVIVEGDQVTLVDCGLPSLITVLSEQPPVTARRHAGESGSAGVDAASVAGDVRQLGALLASLLGDVPTVRSAGGDVLTTRDGAVDFGGDLGAIVRVALGRDPHHRYPSVGAFRTDLQRWLERRPVSARSGVFYRSERFVSRRWKEMALAAGVVLLAGTALGPRLSTWYASAADPGRSSGAVSVLDGLLAAGSGEVVAGPPGARGFVDRAAALVRRDLAGQPSEQARLLLSVARSYVAVGAPQPALDALEEALLLRTSLHGEDSLEVAQVLHPLGEVRHMLGRIDEAEASLRMAAAIQSLRLGPADPATVGSNVALASALRARGDHAAAERLLRAAIEALGAAGDSLDARSGDLRIRTLTALAAVLRERGVSAEAIAFCREALAVAPGGSREGDEARALAQLELARLLLARVDLDEADSNLTAARTTLRRLYPADHPALLDLLLVQARLRLEQGRTADTRAAIDEAQRIQRYGLGVFTPAVPAIRAVDAELARREGRLDDAVALARLALDESERSGVPAYPLTIEARATLGESLIGLNRRDEAGVVIARALADAEQLTTDGDPRLTRLRMGMLAVTTGRGPAGAPR